MARAKPVPDGYHTVTPYLIVDGAKAALEFYRAAFGAEVLFRIEAPGGKLGHAEIQLGDSRIMLADEYPPLGARGPKSIGGSPITLTLYVEDCDAVFERAIQAGAKVIRPLADQFYGDRIGGLEDPFGHHWYVATHQEDLTPEEITRRAAAAHGG
ncbi:MAG: VOC family protein [Planctomycetes bacterium]|nr:VOC family protein [Planctomycetota bacterium]